MRPRDALDMQTWVPAPARAEGRKQAPSPARTQLSPTQTWTGQEAARRRHRKATKRPMNFWPSPATPGSNRMPPTQTWKGRATEGQRNEWHRGLEAEWLNRRVLKIHPIDNMSGRVWRSDSPIS